MKRLFLREDLAALWHERDPFEAAFALEGTMYRAVAQRQTLAFTHADRRYFIKRHRGVTWWEIVKNLGQLRLPVASARNEYRALRHLQALGVAGPAVAGYGRRGWWPSQLESFLVTDDVGEHVTLEDHCRGWDLRPPVFAGKRALLLQVAELARTLHEGGLFHRDFYLCHLLLRANDGSLAVLDLHRALLRPLLSKRWRVKDLGSLYFSALRIGLTRRDLLRFMTHYTQRPLRELLTTEIGFWRAVKRRALELYYTP